MIPVQQTILHDPANGKVGNCFSAVLASLLYIPIEEIPVLTAKPETWLQDLNTWLGQFGLGFIQHEDYDIWTDCLGLLGSHHTLSGNTNRSTDVSHACVGLNGQVVFDPHPSKSGLTKINTYGAFIALRPWEVVHANTMTVVKANEILSEENLFLLHRTEENNLQIDVFGGVDHVTIDGNFTKEQLQAMVFLMEEKEKNVRRNVTQQEHNVLVAAAAKASTLIAQGD